MADASVYTTLFHEREDSAQYWLPSYIMIREEQWLSTLHSAGGSLSLSLSLSLSHSLSLSLYISRSTSLSSLTSSVWLSSLTLSVSPLPPLSVSLSLCRSVSLSLCLYRVVDGGTGSVVAVRSHADLCGTPTCEELRAVVTASDGGGVYGVSFGRSALSSLCGDSAAGSGRAFDTAGYGELVTALESEAAQEIEQAEQGAEPSTESGKSERQVHREPQHLQSHSRAAGGDETR